MGYAYCYGPCFRCKKSFTFNPMKVPSVRDGAGVKQPICLACVQWANPQRAAKGLPLIVPEPDAYEACTEEELH